MKRAILLMVLCTAACQTALIKQGTGPTAALTGVVSDSKSGAPVEGAFVNVYTDTNTLFFGPPNYSSRGTNTRGEYQISLPPGKYYVLARKRQSGSYQGPLQRDDYFSEAQARPIRIGQGTTSLDLHLQQLEGQQFYRPEKFGSKTDTAIMGRVFDQAGKPVFSSNVFAYRDIFKKSQPPQYISLGTEEDGHYAIYLDSGGEFIVGARMSIRMPPAKGELLGFYGSRERKISVKRGTVTEGIDIVIAPFDGNPEVAPGAIPFHP